MSLINQQLDDEGRPTWAEINTDALRSNFEFVQEIVGRGVTVAPAVKADAYGHGAIQCARVLERAGAKWLCVALPEEGLALRRANINAFLLVLNGFWGEQASLCLRERLTPVLYRADMVESFNEATRERGQVADIHIKIDTGMGRLGVRWDAVREFAETLAKCENIKVAGVMTHFAAADEKDKNDFTRTQVKRYEAGLEILKAHGINPTYCDMANSAAIFSHSYAHGNMVRPGGVIYGLRRDVLQSEIGQETDFTENHSAKNHPSNLRAVMSVKTRVTLLKEINVGETIGYGCTFRANRKTRVATLPIGYADGVPRALSNTGQVIIRGRFAPIIGRVSMDLTLVDVTDVREVELWDEAVFIGRDGACEITAEDVGTLAGTFSYEITCGISPRVPRR